MTSRPSNSIRMDEILWASTFFVRFFAHLFEFKASSNTFTEMKSENPLAGNFCRTTCFFAHYFSIKRRQFYTFSFYFQYHKTFCNAMETSSGLSKLLGDVLVNQQHQQIALSEVVKDKKYVGLYFSASK